MPKICYIPKRFNDQAQEIIHRVNSLIGSYKKQGYNLTLRQVYYQFVARDGWLPAAWADKVTGSVNNVMSYKKLGNVINDARLAGLIDWHAIEDRTRERGGNTHWTSPQDIINACANSYQIDKWAGQPYHVEVWVEKDALEDVVGTVCKRLDVPFFSCRGYTSQTAMWDNAILLKNMIEKEERYAVILHLGDMDPSGCDMSRDIEDRVRMFLEGDPEMGETGASRSLIFKRIALNMDQVRTYNPPPNPAKATDSRFQKFADQHGEESWELDALDPTVISNIIEKAVLEYRVESIYDIVAKKEADEKKLLEKTAATWPQVTKFLQEKKP